MRANNVGSLRQKQTSLQSALPHGHPNVGAWQRLTASPPFSFFHATATAALASKGPRLTFRTVLVETPSRAAILRMLSRARKAARMRASSSGAIGRPAKLFALVLGPS